MAESFGWFSVRTNMLWYGNAFELVNIGVVGAAASPGHVYWIAVLSVLPMRGQGVVSGRGVR